MESAKKINPLGRIKTRESFDRHFQRRLIGRFPGEDAYNDPNDQGEVLGSGAFGQVKRLKSDPESAVKTGQLTAREMRIAMRAGGMGIAPKVYGASPGAYRMALLQGYKPFPFEGGDAEMFEKLGTSVGKLHSAGIIHGDLQPRNLMYNAETGDVKLVDFGEAIDEKSGKYDNDLWDKARKIDVGTDFFKQQPAFREAYERTYRRPQFREDLDDLDAEPENKRFKGEVLKGPAAFPIRPVEL